MIFESLWPLAFLLAVPVVVILYLLVPKGTDTPVSSNLLWKKLFYNEQSKTFWEKFLAQSADVSADRDPFAAYSGTDGTVCTA